MNLLTQERDLMLDKLKENLSKAQNCMKQQAHKKRRDVEFNVDDWVYPIIQQYMLKSLARKHGRNGVG